jgi:hypothetical protein
MYDYRNESCRRGFSVIVHAFTRPYVRLRLLIFLSPPPKPLGRGLRLAENLVDVLIDPSRPFCQLGIREQTIQRISCLPLGPTYKLGTSRVTITYTLIKSCWARYRLNTARTSSSPTSLFSFTLNAPPAAPPAPARLVLLANGFPLVATL